jgi:hypothetical protein
MGLYAANFRQQWVEVAFSRSQGGGGAASFGVACESGHGAGIVARTARKSSSTGWPRSWSFGMAGISWSRLFVAMAVAKCSHALAATARCLPDLRRPNLGKLP